MKRFILILLLVLIAYPQSLFAELCMVTAYCDQEEGNQTITEYAPADNCENEAYEVADLLCKDLSLVLKEFDCECTDSL